MVYRPRSTRLSRFMLFSIENHLILSMHETINPLLRVIVESLNMCAESGAGGRRFLVTELRGDQSWFRLLFQHRSYWKTNSVCFRCSASQKDPENSYLFYDKWMNTRRSTEQFLMEELPQEMSCLPLQIIFQTIFVKIC